MRSHIVKAMPDQARDLTEHRLDRLGVELGTTYE